MRGFAQLIFLFHAAVEARNCVCRSKNFEGPKLDISMKHPEVDVHSGKDLVILNSCSFEVSLGVTGSDVGVSGADGCSPHQINNGEGRCFWYFEDIPASLEPGSKWNILLNSKNDHVFSGNVWGVKHGDDHLMEKACPRGECKPWIGPRGAVTKAEFTFSKSGTDYFDISIIEGANIPMAMYAADADPDPTDRYKCGVAGGCPWVFEPEPHLKKFVTEVTSVGSEKVCEEDGDCESDQKCGSTFDGTHPTYGVCGKFNGYASAHVSCTSGATGPPFFCETHHDVISCMGDYHLSGYNQPHGTVVCGCPDWVSMGIDAPSTVPCQTSDENWEKNSLPYLIFLKKGCPLAYEFAYSDMTSTVTCDRASKYMIEFCPGDSESNFF
jgi:hypothetical protein